MLRPMRAAFLLNSKAGDDTFDEENFVVGMLALTGELADGLGGVLVENVRPIIGA